MADMKFLDDIDLSLCELKNHLLHNVGGTLPTTESQLYYNTASGVNRMEYHDGTSAQVPITMLRIGDDSLSSVPIFGDKTAAFQMTGDGITVDGQTSPGNFVFTNDHKTIQSMSDLASTPGASNDGYALLWNNSASGFELVDLATVTTSGSFVTTNTNQTVGGQKIFSDAITFQDETEFQNNVVIQGDLLVSGNHVLTQPETVVIEDNLMVLNSNHTGAPSEDAGILVNRGSSTNAAFVWDESTDAWTFITTTDDGTGATPTVASYADIKAADATFSTASTSGLLTAGNGLDVFGTLILGNQPNSHTIDVTDTEFLIRSEGTGEVEKITLAELKAEVGTKVTGTITGNGSLTSFTFTHSIGSLAVDITLIEDSTGDKVFATCRNISTTQSQISFKYPVASSKTYTVIAQ